MKIYQVDSWLSIEDLERCWRVVHGELPLSFMSKKEEIEFLRVIHDVGTQKMSNASYLSTTLQ